jgi:hypothetical protein
MKKLERLVEIENEIKCSGCGAKEGGQHKPSCSRQGLVTRASDYRDHHQTYRDLLALAQAAQKSMEWLTGEPDIDEKALRYSEPMRRDVIQEQYALRKALAPLLEPCEEAK